MKSSVLLDVRVIVAWFLVAPALVSAHHGISAKFDTQGNIEIRGEIAEVTWRNPHVLFTIDVTDSDGRQALWSAETLSTGMMRKNDIPSGLLRPGETVRIAGLPSLHGANDIYPTNLLLSDGREIVFNARVEPRWSDAVVGKSGPNHVLEGDGSEPERGIFRVWSSTSATPAYYSSLNLDNNPLSAPAPTRPAPTRPAGEPRGEGATATDCTPKGLPSAMAQPYPMEFVREGGDILLRIEEYDAVRTIHMNADEATAVAPRSLMGYSTGRWEGDTLVVTTTQLRDPRSGGGIRIGEAAELVERFTASPDGSRLDYRIAITDPGLTEAVELEKFWLYVPGMTVEPYDCVPG